MRLFTSRQFSTTCISNAEVSDERNGAAGYLSQSTDRAWRHEATNSCERRSLALRDLTNLFVAILRGSPNYATDRGAFPTPKRPDLASYGRVVYSGTQWSAESTVGRPPRSRKSHGENAHPPPIPRIVYLALFSIVWLISTLQILQEKVLLFSCRCKRWSAWGGE